MEDLATDVGRKRSKGGHEESAHKETADGSCGIDTDAPGDDGNGRAECSTNAYDYPEDGAAVFAHVKVSIEDEEEGEGDERKGDESDQAQKELEMPLPEEGEIDTDDKESNTDGAFFNCNTGQVIVGQRPYARE